MITSLKTIAYIYELKLKKNLCVPNSMLYYMKCFVNFYSLFTFRFNQCVPSGGIKVEGKTVRPSVKSKK